MRLSSDAGSKCQKWVGKKIPASGRDFCADAVSQRRFLALATD